MRSLKLLSPVGDFPSLTAAINNGADAIYLGSKLFNARRLANNFTTEELQKAVQYAHLNNVKVYLTLNTLIKNHEIPALLNQISIAAQLNIDALIMQDLTFAPLIKQHFPHLQIHASTQATIMNTESINFWKKHIDTFVLARELTKQEVKTIYQNTNANLEIFIHGHLCISYSGQCLISSLIGKRSGNRGMCASSCRKPYNNSNSYLLSAKDLCMINNIPDIIEAGVKTVKIEGRMKPAEYVAATTKYYRQQIERYYKNNHKPASENTIANLKMAFNREFTQGYFNNEKNIVDQTYSSKRGIYLGTIRSGQLELEEDIELNDGIGIVSHGERNGNYLQKIFINNVEVEKAKKGQKVKLLLPNFENGAKVYLMSKSNGENIIGEPQKISFNINLSIKENEPVKIKITIQEQEKEINLETTAVKPEKHPFTKEQLEKELRKYHSDIFELKNINIKTDNSFILKSVLTKLRSELDQTLLNLLKPINQKKEQIPTPIYPKSTTNQKMIHVQVYNLQGVQDAINAKADIIYYDAFAKDLTEAINLTKNSSSKLYLHTPMALTDSNIEILKEIIKEQQPQGIQVNNVGLLNLNLDIPIILGYQMNIFNDNQLQYYNHSAIASIELNLKELSEFKQKDKLIYYAHGKPVVMSFKETFNTDHLTDEKKYTFELRKTTTGTTQMLYSKAIGLLQHTPKIIEAGITQLYLDLDIEKDVFNLTSVYKRLLNGENVSVEEFQHGVTVGNLVKGVM